jgi:hypothetical protein
MFFQIVLLAWPGASAFAAELHPPFDFATAERNADVELKRPVAPVVKEQKPAPPPVQPAPLCQLCKGTGQIPCTLHPKQFVCVYSGAAEIDVCKLCKNLGFMPCTACKANPKPEAKEKYQEAEAAFTQANTAAQDVVKEIEADGGADRLSTHITGYSAPHISVASNLTKVLTQACMQHSEALLPKLEKAFNGPVFSFTSPQNTRIYLLDKSPEYLRFLQVIWKPRFPSSDVVLYAKTSGTRAFQLPSLGVICFEKVQRSQELLVHDFVHMYSHLLLNRVATERQYTPWIEEGFAAYAESLELNSPLIYCIQYDVNNLDIQKNRAKALLAMARANKPVQMEKLTQITFMDMKTDEYFQAWSMITMLIERDPAKFVAFLQAMPESVSGVAGGEIKAADQEKALKDAYGYDFPKLLSVWRQYVLATVR